MGVVNPILFKVESGSLVPVLSDNKIGNASSTLYGIGTALSALTHIKTNEGDPSGVITGTTGDILSDITNNKLWISQGGTIWTELSTGTIAGDIIKEGNSSVEVIDAGTGSVVITVDGGVIGTFSATGLALSALNMSGAITSTIANEGNVVGLTITQNDVINNKDALVITQNANATGIQINCNNNKGGWYVLDTGSTDTYSCKIYHTTSTRTGTNANALLSIWETVPDSTADVFAINDVSGGRGIFLNKTKSGVGFEIDYAGTDTSVFLNNNGSSTGNRNMYLTRNNANATLEMVGILQEHASCSTTVFNLVNDGTGKTLNIEASGTRDSTIALIRVYDNSASLVQEYRAGLLIQTNNGSNTSYTAEFRRDAGDGTILYLHANNAESNHEVAYFLHNHVDTTTPVLILGHNGNGSHLRFTGDPLNSSPTDGDFWFDGTDLKIKVGATVYTIDKTSV